MTWRASVPYKKLPVALFIDVLWYYFFTQGVECFDYSHTLNVICTGGVDHAVRLWNPYVTVKPVAIMKGHQSSIIDLAIHEALEQVFSYDKDGVRNKKRRIFFRAHCLSDWKRSVVRCDVISAKRYNVYSARMCCKSAVIITRSLLN